MAIPGLAAIDKWEKGQDSVFKVMAQGAQSAGVGNIASMA